MKKYLVGLTAIVVAVVSFAFTAPKKINFTDYVWYGIKTSVHLPCATDLSTIELTDLNIDARFNNTGNFSSDITDVTFSESGSAVAYSCGQVQTELCAVGYLKPASGNTGFEVQDGKWVPTIEASVKICRPTP